MTTCLHCSQSFDAETLVVSTPEVQVGILLAKERYGDEGRVCGECLASRGCLAMMYDDQFRR